MHEVSPFRYEAVVVRKHGPSGYSDYGKYKPFLRDEFSFRCVYCLCRERWFPSGHAAFSADHVVPQSVDPRQGGVYGNLVYACVRCNSERKAARVPDPTDTAFSDLLTVGDDGIARSKSNAGRRLIRLLRLNEPQLIRVRLCYLRILRLWKKYPNQKDVLALYRDAFGFPDDLPDLASLRPPKGNAKPDGARSCFFSRRDSLPEVY